MDGNDELPLAIPQESIGENNVLEAGTLWETKSDTKILCYLEIKRTILGS